MVYNSWQLPPKAAMFTWLRVVVQTKRNGGSENQSRRLKGAWKCFCSTTAFFLLPSSGRKLFNIHFYFSGKIFAFNTDIISTIGKCNSSTNDKTVFFMEIPTTLSLVLSFLLFSLLVFVPFAASFSSTESPVNQGFFCPYCVTRARRFLMRSAACLRVIRFRQSGQYLTLLEVDAKEAPHSVQRFLSSVLKTSAYSSLSRGSTAVWNHLHRSE